MNPACSCEVLPHRSGIMQSECDACHPRRSRPSCSSASCSCSGSPRRAARAKAPDKLDARRDAEVPQGAPPPLGGRLPPGEHRCRRLDEGVPEAGRRAEGPPGRREQVGVMVRAVPSEFPIFQHAAAKYGKQVAFLGRQRQRRRRGGAKRFLRTRRCPIRASATATSRSPASSGSCRSSRPPSSSTATASGSTSTRATTRARMRSRATSAATPWAPTRRDRGPRGTRRARARGAACAAPRGVRRGAGRPARPGDRRARRRGLHLVAVVDGAIVGTCRVLLAGDQAKLGRMVVARDARGRGIGAALLAEAERARAWHGLHTDRARRPDLAMGLYERAGYTTHGDIFLDAGHRARDDGEVACLRSASTRSRACASIIAAERAAAPGRRPARSPRADPIDPETDPFLEGHEDRTPPELDACARRRRARRARAGRCASCPNLYPALTPDGAEPAARRQPGPVHRAAGARRRTRSSSTRPSPVTSLADLEPSRSPRRWTCGARGCATTREPAPRTCT